MRLSQWYLGLVLGAALLTSACGGGEGGPFVEFRELVTNPDEYQGKTVCTEGTYAGGFEASALGEYTWQGGNSVYLTEPAIWIEEAEFTSRDNCFTTNSGSPVEFCKVRACGVFEYGGSYGHLDGYHYQLSSPGE